MSLLSIAEFAGPLLAASGGSLVAEKSGRANMALEGLVTAGAFSAAAAARAGAHPVAAVVLAALATGILALLYSLFLSKTGADPVISGIAINILLPAAVSVFAERAVGSAGLWRFGAGMGVGGSIACAIAGALLYAAAWIFLSRFRDGLRIRAAGSSESALVAAGGNIEGTRSIAFVASGLGTGLSGGLMAISLGAFSPGMSAGRGWLALASVYAGRKSPSLSLVAVLAFTLANAFAIYAQSVLPVPHEFSSSIPPIVALIALGLSKARRMRASR